MFAASRFIHPFRGIPETPDWNRASLLSVLLLGRALALWVLYIYLLFRWVPASSSVLAALVLNALAYLVSRTRFYRWAAWVVIIEALFLISLMVVQSPEQPAIMVAPVWFGLGIFIAAMTLSFRETMISILLTVLAFAVMLRFVVNSEARAILEVEMVFLLALGTLAAASTVMRDQADRKLMVEKSKVVQASRMSLIGDMAGGIAHEINTPLTVIQFKIDEIMERLEQFPSLSEDLRPTAETISETVGRISRVVKALRNFARETNHEEPREFRLSEVVTEVQDLCRERFGHSGVRLVTENCDPRLILVGQRNQISQVLLNLLSNSYYAAKDTANGWVRIEFKTLPQSVQIHVVDSGYPLPRKTIDRLFMPFFTTKPMGEGLGLSLSVSKGIVEQHLGRIFFDERSLETRFVIELPRLL